MNDEKKYTERDLILAKREGWLACYDAFPWHGLRMKDDAVKRRYPLPKKKVERPRVVRDPHDPDVPRPSLWRYVAGEFEFDTGVGEPRWQRRYGTPITPERVKLWADLLSNPTELVEDSADAAE